MMERNNKPLRSHWLHLRLRADEHQKLTRKWKASTCRKLSEYVRIRLFDKPLTVLSRNASMDEGLLLLAQLREELNALGNNLNQLTRKANTEPGVMGKAGWQTEFFSLRATLVIRLEAIGKAMNELSTAWLRS